MSKKQYTYIDKRGNRLFVREAWREEDGTLTQSCRTVDEFDYELFLPASEGVAGDSLSLTGMPLSRLKFTDIDSLREFAESGRGAHGMDEPAAQWVAKTYPNEIVGDMSLLSILNIDIEVEHSEGFPDPVHAAQEVLSITMKYFGSPSVTLGLKPLERKGYINCFNETELLKTFLQLYTRRYPDIITGWNVDLFDMTYMVNRITNVLGHAEAKRLSPFSAKHRDPIQPKSDYRGESYYKILGITTVDYLELYKKFSPAKLESYKLEYVSQQELGTGKVDLTPFGGSLMRLYHEQFELFVEYNDRDVELVEKLDGKLSFLELLMTITYMVKGRVEDSQATVRPWDTLLYNMLLAKGKQPPPSPKTKNQKIVGGFVKEPIPGLKRWVVTLDLKSLYPNIAITLNMSPETIVRRGEPIIDEILAGTPVPVMDGCAIAANGSQYRQDIVGIIPEAMSYLLTHRDVKKDEMKAWKRQQQKALADGDEGAAKDAGSAASRTNAVQLALKVLANGGYGAIANKYFRYYDTDIAEGITMTGQTIIRFIGDRISDKMNELMGTEGVDYVIGSDTDSCMTSIEAFIDGYIEACGMPENYNDLVDIADQFVSVNLEDGVLTPHFAELSARLGSARPTLSMKREAIADRGLFRAKKHYVLQVWDNEGVRYSKPDMKMVGIETARTTTPKMCREMIEEALVIIMNRSEEELVEKYKGWKDVFMAAPAHEIAFPRGVNEIKKWTGGDGAPIKGTPVQVKAAIAYNTMLERCGMKEITPIREGNKLKFLYLKPNNPIGSNVIGIIDELHAEFGLDMWIDREMQFEKALSTPIESFTCLVGWNATGRRASLGDVYFSAEAEDGEGAPVASRAKPRVSAARVTPVRDEERVRGTSTRAAKTKRQPKPTLDALFG